MRRLLRQGALLAALLVWPGLATVQAWCAGEEPVPEPFWTKLWDRFAFGGFLETAQAVRTGGNHAMTVSFLRGRLEARFETDWFHAFANAEVELNRQVEAMNEIRLREAWVEHDADLWDIRVGRQIIIWGRADGLRITDNISPPDYTDMVLRGTEDTHKPVTAVKFRLLGESLAAEFIWKPFSEPMDLPCEDGPWALNLGMDRLPKGVGLRMEDDERHRGGGIDDSEFAVKLSRSGAGFDASASFAYVWDSMPAYDLALQFESMRPVVVATPRHSRIGIWGLDVAVPWDAFVFRGEAALFSGRQTYRKDGSLRRCQLLKYLAGVDWDPGHGWNVTAQFADDWILDYAGNLSADQHKPLGTLSVSKKFLRDTLVFKEQVFSYLHDGQTMNRISAEYDLADGLKLSAGWDHFTVDNDSYYKNFGNNDQLWFKIRYSF